MCVLTILNRKTLNVIKKANPRESMKSVIPTIFKSGLPSPEDVFHTMSNFQQLWTLYVYTMSNLFTAMNSLCLWLSRNKLAYEIILPYSHTLLEMRFRGTRQRIASTGTARPPTCLRKSASCPPRGPEPFVFLMPVVWPLQLSSQLSSPRPSAVLRRPSDQKCNKETI